MIEVGASSYTFHLEEECERLQNLTKKLEREIEELKCYKQENEMLKAQLDMVYLIFGKE